MRALAAAGGVCQKLDNDSIVTVNIDGNNYMTGTTAIKLTDDTKPQLTLSAKQQDVTEGGKLTLTITAERQSATDKAISLSCDLPSRFRIPANICMNCEFGFLRSQIGRAHV